MMHASRLLLTPLAAILSLSLAIASSNASVLRIGMLATPESYNVSVSYDNTYDDGSTPLSTVACPGGSNANGKTLSSLRAFPYIGGADIVGGYNSARCGSCWRLTYNNSTATNVAHVALVDSTKEGWTVALRVMDDLTDGHGRELGRVDATATLVSRSHCGM